MIEVKVDEKELEQLYNQQLKEFIRNKEKEFIFWDTTELKKQTKMSWNTIQEKFFFDPRLPKKKIGGKWYYHGEKTKQFLSEWFNEQE